MVEELIRLEENHDGIYDIVYSRTDELMGTIRANEEEAELQNLEGDFSLADYELFLEDTEDVLRDIFNTDNYYRLAEQVNDYARY